jgi:hypothetical protein
MSGAFVAAMEDVLALYALPYDGRYPTVCLDEKPVVLHTQVRASLPLAPGQVERRDYEYERRGQPLCLGRAARRVAACPGHQPPYQAGLR